MNLEQIFGLRGVQSRSKKTGKTNYQYFIIYSFMSITVVPPKALISIEDLEKVDIRVGTIKLVEDVPKSDKLVRLTVDFGSFERKILSGIKKERANVREIEGKQALFVVNLAPRKIMGESSEGMIYDIGFADGINPALAVPERQVPNGARAG